MAWSTTSSLGIARSYLTSCGTSSSALAIGGYTGDAGALGIANVDIWNSSSWSTTTSHPVTIWYNMSAGSTSSALSWGGYRAGSVNINNIWSGSSWSTTTALPNSKNGGQGVGTTSRALSMSGTSAGVSQTSCELWSGSSWATTTNVNVARYGAAGVGNSNIALMFAGYQTALLSSSEKWSGSSWATTTSFAYGSFALYGIGSFEFAIGGNGSEFYSYRWNSSSWATTSNTNVNRSAAGDSGNYGKGDILLGGYTSGTYTNTSEIWSDNIITISGTVEPSSDNSTIHLINRSTGEHSQTTVVVDGNYSFEVMNDIYEYQVVALPVSEDYNAIIHSKVKGAV